MNCMYDCEDAVTHTVMNTGGLRGLCRYHADRYGYPQYLTPLVASEPVEAPSEPAHDMEFVTSRRSIRRIRQFLDMRRSPLTATLTPSQESAYRQYVSDGLADTDGHYAPLSRQGWLREAPAETGTKTCGTCGTVEEFECTDGWTKISVAVCGKCVSDGADGITTLDSEIDCTCDHCIETTFVNGHIEKGHFGGTRAECPGCMAECHCGPLLAPWKCVRCDARERKA